MHSSLYLLFELLNFLERWPASFNDWNLSISTGWHYIEKFIWISILFIFFLPCMLALCIPFSLSLFHFQLFNTFTFSFGSHILKIFQGSFCLSSPSSSSLAQRAGTSVWDWDWFCPPWRNDEPVTSIFFFSLIRIHWLTLLSAFSGRNVSNW